MAESRERDPLGSTSESEGENTDERMERRRRRQELKTAIADEAALDADESESHDEGVKECEERLRRIRTTPADVTAIAGTSMSNKDINVVLSEASPSGAGEKSQS